MSNKRRRLSEVPTPGPGQGYGFQCALIKDRTKATPDEVQNVEKLTHDLLVGQAGDRRRSDVWWTSYYGAEAERLYLSVTEDAPHTRDPELVEAIHDNPRAHLVTAWCIEETPHHRRRDFPTFLVKPLPCPSCGEECAAATGIGAQARPVGKYAVICGYCATPAIREGDTVRRPTDTELVELSSQPNFQAAVRAAVEFAARQAREEGK